jgi:hypothetical protein
MVLQKTLRLGYFFLFSKSRSYGQLPGIMGNQGGWVFPLETLIYTLAPFVTIVVPFEDIK